MSLLRVDGSKDANRARARNRTRNARTNAHERKSSHKQMPQIYLCVNKPLIDFNWIESYRHAEQIIADLFCALMIYLNDEYTPTKRNGADEIPLNLSIDRELEIVCAIAKHKAHIQSWPQNNCVFLISII